MLFPDPVELVRVDPRDRILCFLDPQLGQVTRTLPNLQPGGTIRGLPRKLLVNGAR